mmetsp:Transcript_3668/g.6797  ORF Transcript_3668/g.6797 Transcript_3668/m.6797 type:complete len:1519 (-) Transcript_3668:99-4655(-)
MTSYEEDEISLFSDGGSDSDFDVENVVPNKAPSKKAATKKGAAVTKKKTNGNSKKKPLVSAKPPAEDASDSNPQKKTSKSKKKIEDTYKKLEPIEHILVRPDTYIGSIERITQPMYVLEASTQKIVSREITYTPGLYKIFDEIVVNAADNRQRDPTGMDRLDIDINQEAGTISVRNNGRGIPIAVHSEHGCYVPELIFGHLLTGSNFDDDERKTTGGRNGYGAKLANIFSTEFTIECYNAEDNVLYEQTFTNNMQTKGKPIISKPNAKRVKKKDRNGDYTRVTFKPDFQRFKMDCLDDDTIGLLCKRAYDVAGCMASTKSLTAGEGKPSKRLSVFLNGSEVPVKDFKSYIGMYQGMRQMVAFDTFGDRWEVGVAESDGSFGQVSFVNSICTYKGGQHVDYVANQVVANLGTVLKRKNKGGADVSKSSVKNHLCVFVNCLVENPAFDSQTKECLTTRSRAFGSKCELTSEFHKKVEKSDIVTSILSFAKYQEDKDKKKSQGRKGGKKLTGVEKLDDANNAGTKKGKDCTLILTEGDSAKTLAVAGISVVGRDWYGCFPLKGKLLNVRDCSHAQFMKNEEIQNIVKILGLEYKKVYTEENIGSLRYGNLMIMADQDHDGSHIKGLVINFIHNEWPSLLNVPGFLKQFITPIVKATKGKQVETFFTVPEYLTWKEETPNSDKWRCKYYKGLGTSTTADAKEYFSDLEKHQIPFATLSKDLVADIVSSGADEMELDIVPSSVQNYGSDLIDMAFSKKRVSDRKNWLNNCDKETFMNYSESKEGVLYSEFINKELVQFSLSDNQRSLPHIMDGFKPSQRKVFFACIKKKLIKEEYKVAQLAGYTAEHTAYHHGENSLAGTIVNMAQTFVGSNNVNLLVPSGQFGSRRLGGKDSASPRYIFTKLESIARMIFHPDDDQLLKYLEDDGLSIEPEFYCPVIPFSLVNGAEGIGTGWSTKIPNYDPREIIQNLRNMIAGSEPTTMHPYYKGFRGSIEMDTSKPGTYKVEGIIERTDDTTLVISELPLQKWTQDYKKFLEEMMTVGGTKNSSNTDLISDFKENHTEDTVYFTITAPQENIDRWEKDKDGLIGKFKLSTTINTTNLTAFDVDGRIYKYGSANDILRTFYNYRLDMYVARKAAMLKVMGRDLSMLSNKAKFVQAVCTGELIVTNRKKVEILADLQRDGYDMFNNDKNDDNEDEENDADGREQTDAELSKGYEYLLGMKIWSLTYEKVRQLLQQVGDKMAEVQKLEATEPSAIWINDLDVINTSLDEIDEKFKAMAEEELELIADAKKRKKFKTPKKKKQRAPAKKKVGTTKAPVAKKEDSKNKQTTLDFTLKTKGDGLVEEKVEDNLEDNDLVDDEIMPLSQRLATQLSVSLSTPAPKSFKSKSKSKPKAGTKKRVSPRSTAISESISTLDTESFKPASVTPGPKRKKVVTSPKEVNNSTDMVSKKKTIPASRRKAIIESSDEESFNFEDSTDSEDDVEVLSPVTRPQRTGRAAARKPVTYTLDCDSDESESCSESDISF